MPPSLYFVMGKIIQIFIKETPNNASAVGGTVVAAEFATAVRLRTAYADIKSGLY
jgi:urea transporter